MPSVAMIALSIENGSEGRELAVQFAMWSGLPSTLWRKKFFEIETPFDDSDSIN